MSAASNIENAATLRAAMGLGSRASVMECASPLALLEGRARMPVSIDSATDFGPRGKSGRGQPQSKALRAARGVGSRASVMECASPLALSEGRARMGGANDDASDFRVRRKSGRGLPQSKALRAARGVGSRASVVECASPLALLEGRARMPVSIDSVTDFGPRGKSGRGLPHSKTSRPHHAPDTSPL